MPESSRHRHAFQIYWRLGADRSIERLHQAMKANERKAPSLRTLYEWSRTYGWQFRIVELEQRAKVAEDNVRMEAIREMAERQAKAGLFLQQKGMEWLVGLDAEAATPEAAVKAIVEGARLERLARGEPTERQNVNGEIDARLATLTDKQLAELTRLAESSSTGSVPSIPG